jgi:glycosyltransferase involved in cell wall biosynthesis
MEAGSFKNVGGAAKDTYKIYTRLKSTHKYDIDVFADYSKIDPSVRPVGKHEMLSTDYDFIMLNSIRDVLFINRYRLKHRNARTKYLYADRGNVLLNLKKAKLSRLHPKAILRKSLLNQMKRWLDYYVAITGEQYEEAFNFFDSKTDVKYILIAPHEEFRRIKMKKDFRGAVAVGRLDERQKRTSFLIEGIKEIVKRDPSMKGKELVRIIGTGKDEKEYRNTVKRLGLEKNITFEGFVVGDRLVRAYNNAGFLVSTSYWEGLSRTFLEAMACGLPLLINADINSIISYKPRETVVTGGSNGLVYESGDLPDFAEKFIKLYRDSKLRKRLGANASKYMKRFSFEKVVKSYEDIIDLSDPLSAPEF